GALRKAQVRPRSETDQTEPLPQAHAVSGLDVTHDPARDRPCDLANPHASPGACHDDLVALVLIPRALLECCEEAAFLVAHALDAAADGGAVDVNIEDIQEDRQAG